MMGKKGVVLTALILVQIAAALEDNYNMYKSLEVDVKIYSTLDIMKASQKATIEMAEADLELFPRMTPEQEIIKEEIITEPKAQTEKKEGYVNMAWENVKGDNISYEIDSKVRTYNRIRKIERKVDFPMKTEGPELTRYTVATEYIDINDGIRDKAAEIAEGETDLYVASYKLGEWVRKNVKYDINTLTASAVQKSSWVLSNKEGVCDEITNLFISMERSLGIPARFVSGMVYSNLNYQFENHGWAEIYLGEYGWVPFDITFGQYGWIDPSHIKMDESQDSGEAAVTYKWRSKNAELTARSMKVEAEVKKKEGKIEKTAKLKVKPVEEDVGFGSYMVIEAEAENTQEYYMPLTLRITKAPEVTDKEAFAHTLLKPREKKKFYWTVKIPEKLDKNYVYTSQIELQSDFAETAEASMRYGQGFRAYSKEWAEQTAGMMAERENKIPFQNIDLSCKADKGKYLSTENAKIICEARNMGNVNMEGIRVCAEDTCRETSLRIAEEKEIVFELDVKKSGNIKIVAEKGNYMKEYTVEIKVEEKPDVRIIEYEPDQIDYREEGTLKLKLFTEAKAKKIEMKIKNIGEVEMEGLEGTYPISVPIKGKQLRKGAIEMKIKYEDEEGNTYLKEEKLLVTVKNLPWYARLMNRLGI